jgi:hypothetical protein
LLIKGVSRAGKAADVAASLSLAVVDRFLQRIISRRLFVAKGGVLRSNVADC